MEKALQLQAELKHKVMSYDAGKLPNRIDDGEIDAVINEADKTSIAC